MARPHYLTLHEARCFKCQDAERGFDLCPKGRAMLRLMLGRFTQTLGGTIAHYHIGCISIQLPGAWLRGNPIAKRILQ